MVTIRLPEPLLEAIRVEIEETDSKRNAVIIKRLMSAYGMTKEQPKPSEVTKLTEAIAQLTDRVTELEKKPEATAA